MNKFKQILLLIFLGVLVIVQITLWVLKIIGVIPYNIFIISTPLIIAISILIKFLFPYNSIKDIIDFFKRGN